MSSWVQGEFKPAQLTQPPLDASCFHLCSCRDHRRHRGRLPLMSGSLFLARSKAKHLSSTARLARRVAEPLNMDSAEATGGEKKQKTSHTSSSSEAAAVDLSSRNDVNHQKLSLPQRFLHRCRSVLGHKRSLIRKEEKEKTGLSPRKSAFKWLEEMRY